jgi:hypothetical protein
VEKKFIYFIGGVADGSFRVVGEFDDAWFLNNDNGGTDRYTRRFIATSGPCFEVMALDRMTEEEVLGEVLRRFRIGTAVSDQDRKLERIEAAYKKCSSVPSKRGVAILEFLDECDKVLG